MYFFFYSSPPPTPAKPCFSLGDVQDSCTVASLGHQLPLLPFACAPPEPLTAWGLHMRGEQAGKLLSQFTFAPALKGLQGSQ